jgi:hypothetical protein
MPKIVSRKKIFCPYSNLFEFIWDIKKWSSFWSPLKEVQVLYDDGFHQEFNLYVSWEGTIATVRTIRFRDNDGNVSFFSPEPPPPTISHYGKWIFLSQCDGSIELIAERNFCYPYQDGSDFTERFHNRLKILLDKIEETCPKLMY